MNGYFKLISTESRFIVISGATGYLGTRLAEHFASKGENLFLIARNRKKLHDLRKSIHKSFDVLIKIKAIDFSKPSAYRRLNRITRNLNVFAGLHTIGLQAPIGPLIKQSPKSLRKSLEVNFMSGFLFAKFCCSRMSNNDRTSLVFFSGGGATFPRIDFGPYGSAKTALIRMIETLSIELKPYNISANIIAPGSLPSQMMDEIIKEKKTVSAEEYLAAAKTINEGDSAIKNVIDLTQFLLGYEGLKITGKLISAKWDDWRSWISHMEELENSDIFTLRRVTTKVQGQDWGVR